MSAHYEAWLCAFMLAQDHADRLTPAQQIACEITVMRHPDRAPLELIALAAQVLGTRT